MAGGVRFSEVQFYLTPVFFPCAIFISDVIINDSLSSCLLVYTCQNSQTKRCGFFLWQDEAHRRAQASLFSQEREESYSAERSKVESDTLPVTPSKSSNQTAMDWSTGLLTPDSGAKRKIVRRYDYKDSQETPTKKIRHRDDPGPVALEEEDDLFCDNDIESVDTNEVSNRQPKGDKLVTNAPVKSSQRGQSPQHQPRRGESLVAEPPSSAVPDPTSQSQTSLCFPQQVAIPGSDRASSFAPSTPTTARFGPVLSSSAPHSDTKQHPPLISQTLTLLSSHNIDLPPVAHKDLVSLLNGYDLRAQGIIKGRDVSRMAIKKREERIQELNRRIEVLEAEREAWKMRWMLSGDEEKVG